MDPTGAWAKSVLILLLHYVQVTFADSSAILQSTAGGSECENDDPLGMISGAIADWQISASSTYPSSWVQGCAEANGRLFKPNGLAWCAKFKSSSEWLQIDLGVTALVTGIMTQGRGDRSEWVTSFMVSYSEDATHWKYIIDQYGNQKIFEGNTDSFLVKHNYLDEPIKARYVKIHTYTWHNHPSLRVELIGCQPCKQLLGIPPYARFAASSSRGRRVQRSCIPEYGHYLSNKAWCPKRQDGNQWLQVDVGPPTLITGILLKGRGDHKRPQYVTRFKLSYSNDSRLWFFYKDATPLDPRIFEGNDESVPERVHYLASPITTRYVRIHPVDWRTRIAMRIGLFGCRQKGPCAAGFFRINNESSCVANLAFKKSAWILPDSTSNQKRNIPGRVPASVEHQNDQTFTATNPRTLRNKMEHRPPMLANHRIGTTSPQIQPPGFVASPFWSGIGSNLRLSTDTGDPVASLAVDGWTGEELFETNSSLSLRSSEIFLNDAPASKNQGFDSIKENPRLKRIPSCTVLEYRWPFVELPSWYVDLRENTIVNGVVIYTGGHGRSTSKVNSENLERLSVFVETEPRTSGTTITTAGTSHLCGYVTRMNDAIFNPRIHISCRQPLPGRFVYVEARGIRGRWSQEFSALLCEVMIY